MAPQDRRQHSQDEEDTQILERPDFSDRRSIASEATETPSERVRSIRETELGSVRFDGNGKAVWEWKTHMQRRRADDDTMDLLKALDPGDLTLEENCGDDDTSGRGFDPYNHDDTRSFKP